MPLIHFVFGGLHRAGDLNKQTESFIEYILIPQKLRASICPEFLPILNDPNARTADPNSVRVLDGGGITFDRYLPSKPVALLPVDVWMVSFADIPLKKMRHWKPASHYGKLGLVFTDEFRRRNKVGRVSYYHYPDLSIDPLVVSLNKAFEDKNEEERERFSKLVTEFRKPAKLWPELNNEFAVLRITCGINEETNTEKLTYSRYAEGYDFTIEQEARLVTTGKTREITFAEADILAIVVPNSKVGDSICEVLSRRWSRVPEIIKFPS